MLQMEEKRRPLPLDIIVFLSADGQFSLNAGGTEESPLTAIPCHELHS
jgi:hypothetical protein